MIQTADDMYKGGQKQIQTQLKMLTEKFKLHETAQMKDPKNWGYVGDLNRWAGLLNEILLNG